ncbi:MAG: hypothetical protein J1E62_05725 [Lachnospiraceae bacterium]|nr:hypothetical protein [Lachnospiraceae bacterium]
MEGEKLMKKTNIKKHLIACVVCLCVAGSINIHANASGNVKNKLFNYKKDAHVTYTDEEFKADATRTYVIYSDGLAKPKVTVVGVSGKKYINCSGSYTLSKYKQYTIKNSVYKNYKYAALRIQADGYGSGYWSPDSTKNYINLG